MKIPDDVFETRCRYCHHGRAHNGNADVTSSRILSSSYHDKLSCEIFGIAQCDKIPGECLSFKPYMYFGICQYCQYNNSFVDGYCTRGEQPNKRQLFLGWGPGGAAADYWSKHCLSTCDNYIVSSRWIDHIIKAVAEGRSPANFDPITLLPLEKCQANAVATTWHEIQEKARAEREAAEAAKEAARRPPDPERDDNQLTMFDIMAAQEEATP